jgi:hypothetical protein
VKVKGPKVNASLQPQLQASIPARRLITDILSDAERGDRIRGWQCAGDRPAARSETGTTTDWRN